MGSDEKVRVGNVSPCSSSYFNEKTRKEIPCHEIEVLVPVEFSESLPVFWDGRSRNISKSDLFRVAGPIILALQEQRKM